MNEVVEKSLARIVALGTFVTTIVVFSGNVTDPVNTPKFLVLGVTSFCAFGVLCVSQVKDLLKRHVGFVFATLLFMLASLNSVIASSSPLSQNVYGSYGRNNGLLTYLFLAILSVSTLALYSKSSFFGILKALVYAGLINIIYGAWVLLFGDFIGWTNPYGNILGTFGNPNFIGSFLGIFFGVYILFSTRPGASKYWKYSNVLVLPITLWEIIESHAIQGRVLAALSVGVLGFFYIRTKFRSMFLVLYSGVVTAFGALALLGAFQYGPLTSIIYKTSVSLRGQYWLAGWNTGNSHPLTGVGMDALGDWYRRMRDLHALDLPGVNTVVNTAHNVPMDMFAFGGWPLLVSYVAMIALGLVSAIRMAIRTKGFDWIQVALTSAWMCYQVQSMISINQIGLAIWGWILTGLLLAYEYSTRESTDKKKSIPTKNEKRASEFSLVAKVNVWAFAFGIVGILVALPPLSSDMKWRSAQEAQSLEAIKGTMSPGYFSPVNSTMYLMNIQTLEQSKLPDLAHQYAIEAVQWNPENYDLWKALYFVSKSTKEEKVRAMSQMKVLDPLNPDVTAP